MSKIKKVSKFTLIFLAVTASVIILMHPLSANAIALPDNHFATSQCGSNDPTSKKGAVTTSIDFGCDGAVCISDPGANYCQTYHNPIIDLTFAIIRLLSDGVGLVIIASLIIAGVQYTFSRGEPQAIAGATRRIQTTVMALALYIFAYALLNYVIPNGLFGQ